MVHQHLFARISWLRHCFHTNSAYTCYSGKRNFVAKTFNIMLQTEQYNPEIVIAD